VVLRGDGDDARVRRVGYGHGVLITLTTTGRRSGRPHAVKLYAFEDGANLLITGSKGGSARDPSWVLNLRADADARVRRGNADLLVRAREVTGRPRERLWRLVCDGFPMYASYQRKTARQFPIFVLEPRGDPDVR
jgi:deazaflavin-dependent oxidoreductase (nitroreductase family)